MLVFALASYAHAHSATLPHAHETDPAAFALLAFWVLAACGLFAALWSAPRGAAS
jgi:hypothetical protein